MVTARLVLLGGGSGRAHLPGGANSERWRAGFGYVVYSRSPQTHQKPCFWYLKTRFFGGENLCFSWFWVPQVVFLFLGVMFVSHVGGFLYGV